MVYVCVLWVCARCGVPGIGEIEAPFGHAPTPVRVVGCGSRARVRLDVVWCRTIALHLSFRVCARARACVVWCASWAARVIADARALDGICATRRVRVAPP